MSRGLRAGAAIACAAAIAGCTWFARKPSAVPPVAVSPPPEPAVVDPAVVEPAVVEPTVVEPESAARVACPNEAAVAQTTDYPRDAVIRGIDGGTATVRFAVDGTKVTLLSVRASDPAFGEAATSIVRRLRCRADRPTVFELTYAWRSRR